MRPSTNLPSSTAEGIFAVDPDFKIVFWSEAAYRLLGYTPEEVLGKYCYQVLVGRDEKGRPLCEEDCAVAALAWLREPEAGRNIAIRTKAGRRLRVTITTTTLPAVHGQPAKLVHLFRVAGRAKA